MGDRRDQPAEAGPKGSREPVVPPESVGLSERALEAAILRAKVKTRARRRSEAAKAARPKLDTNPELDDWFD